MSFFEIWEDSEVAVIWFLDYPFGDILAMVHRLNATAPWGLTVRVRTRLDDEIDPKLTKDRKKGWGVEGEPTDASRDDLIASADRVMADMKKKFLGRLYREEMFVGGKEFFKRWARLPFTHAFISAKGPTRPQ